MKLCKQQVSNEFDQGKAERAYTYVVADLDNFLIVLKILSQIIYRVK